MPNRPRSEPRSGWLAGVAPALPAAVWYAVFFVLPLAIILVYSVGYKPPSGSAQSSIALDRLSLDNYRATATPLFAELFLLTLRTAIVGTALCLLVAFPVAYTLATRVPERWRSMALAAIIVPFWTSFLLRTFAWRILLAANGPLSEALQYLGVLGGPLRVLDTVGAVQLGVVYNYLPMMIFPIFVTLHEMDPALREASMDLGAGHVRTFLSVTLPLALPGVSAGLGIVFVPLAGEYVTPAILGGVRGAMAGNLIASQFLEAQNWALGAAQAVVLVALILLVVGLAWCAGAGLRVLTHRRTDIWRGTTSS